MSMSLMDRIKMPFLEDHMIKLVTSTHLFVSAGEEAAQRILKSTCIVDNLLLQIVLKDSELILQRPIFDSHPFQFELMFLFMALSKLK